MSATGRMWNFSTGILNIEISFCPRYNKRKEVYPLAEALQDAYVRILMSKVLEKNDGSGDESLTVIRSEKQPWN